MLSDNMHLIALSLFVYLHIVSSTVWLRNPNDRGPTAINAGVKCLCTMAKYYFSDRRVTRTANLGYFYSKNMSAPLSDIELNFLVQIHFMVAHGLIDGLQIRIISDEGKTTTSVYEPPSVMFTDYYAFVIDDIAKFDKQMKSIVSKASSWNPGARFLLLFNSLDQRVDAAGRNGTDIASSIFELLYLEFNVERVVILYATGIKTYSIYVTNLYGDEKGCRTLEPILKDECDNGVLKDSESTKVTIQSTRVPEKIPACTFTFCAKESEPYMNQNCTSGLEIEIVHILQDVMKFKTNTICSTLPRGYQAANKSWTGILGLLKNDECDFVVGGLFPDNDEYKDFVQTTTYFEDTYTWFVFLAPFRSPWKGLIEIFESGTWLLIILTLFIAAVSWLLFGTSTSETNSHKKLVLCMMNSLAVFLGMSSNNRPKDTPLRIFFVLLALYGLNITTIYTSKLITVFKEPAHDQQITTIKEILNGGIPIGGRKECADWFKNNSNSMDQIISKRYNSSDRFQPTIENMKLVRDGIISILSSRIFVLSYDLQADIFGIPGNVLSNPLEMIARRGFPPIRKFNSLIDRMKDTGLISKISQDFLYKKTILDKIHHRKDASQIALTIQHLKGAFAILIYGLMISSIVFIIEHILNIKINCRKTKNKIGKRFNQLRIKSRRQKKRVQLRKLLK